MSKTSSALYHLRQMDDLAAGKSFIHQVHPLAKVLTTFVFLVVVVSFDKYEIAGLIGLFFYPIILVVLAQLPIKLLLKRLLVLEPIIIGIGILNPLFDEQNFVAGSLSFSAGWIVFFSIFLKGTLTISAGLILIATTGADRVAQSLRMLKVPRILVLQFLLTYRYVLVLIEEVSRMNRAYFLRAPAARGIHYKDWGSFAGQLLLRTYDRAQRIYVAMLLRGFQGEYRSGRVDAMRGADIRFALVWTLFFIVCRWIPLSSLIAIALKGIFGT